jgi:hypothetical protein
MSAHTPARHDGAPLRRRGQRAPLWAAGLIWLAAGAALTWWLLGLVGAPAWQPLPGGGEASVTVDPAAVARALGHDERAGTVSAPPAGAAGLRLVGVVAQPDAHGAALIAVGDAPPQPYLVGSPVGDDWVLRAVGRARAWLAPRAATGDDELELVLEGQGPP